MKEYLFLLGAIVFEVTGTILLPFSQNFTRILPTVIIGLSYAISLYFLTLSINKLPLPLVYSSWAGLGVFTIALLSYFLYDQKLTWQGVVGLIFIVVGVAMVNVFKV